VQELPQKEFYKLSEVCQYTETQPYVLRFWESEFPQLRPGKSASGQPLYRRADIDLVRRIKQLLHEEAQTLETARRRLADELSPAQPVTRPQGPGSSLMARPAASRSDAAPAPAPPAVGSEDEVVPRRRYLDAVDEIAHLRVALQEADQARERAESTAAEAEAVARREAERARRAVAYLERLREILS
jgi:DNA-binding transcriptional MerR regulator